MLVGSSYLPMYIALDPEYFILAEVDNNENRSIKIKRKVSIIHTRTTYDPKDSKVMTVHFYSYGTAGNCEYSYIHLAFESSINLTTVLKVIDKQKKYQVECLKIKIDSFLECCIQAVGLNLKI